MSTNVLKCFSLTDISDASLVLYYSWFLQPQTLCWTESKIMDTKAIYFSEKESNEFILICISFELSIYFNAKFIRFSFCIQYVIYTENHLDGLCLHSENSIYLVEQKASPSQPLLHHIGKQASRCRVSIQTRIDDLNKGPQHLHIFFSSFPGSTRRGLRIWYILLSLHWAYCRKDLGSILQTSMSSLCSPLKKHFRPTSS